MCFYIVHVGGILTASQLAIKQGGYPWRHVSCGCRVFCTSQLLCGQIWLGHYDARHGLLAIQGSGKAGTGVGALLPSPCALVTILPGRTYRLGFRSHKALFCYTVKSMQNNKPWYCRRLMIIVFTMIYGVVLWCVELRLPWLLLFRIKLIIDPSETPVVTMRYHHKAIWSQEGSHTFEIAVHFSLQKDRFCTSSDL